MAIGFKIGDIEIESIICKRVNIKITKDDLCSYDGKCKKDSNITNDLCQYCKYRKFLDIPSMIEQKLKEKQEG